jgi:hypothetical protein
MWIDIARASNMPVDTWTLEMVMMDREVVMFHQALCVILCLDT